MSRHLLEQVSRSTPNSAGRTLLILALSLAPLAAQTPTREKVEVPRSAAGGERFTPHRDHQTVTLPRTEAPASAVRREQPEPGHPGDLFGQEPLPAHLLGKSECLAFVGGEYVPPRDERIDPELRRRQQTATGQTETYGFVMFAGGVTTRGRERVEALGVKLHDHHTFGCMTATIPFAALPALAAEPAVRWVGYARAHQKLDPTLAAHVAKLTANDRTRLLVKVYRSDLGPRTQREIDMQPLAAAPTPRAALGEVTRTIPHGPCQTAFEQAGARVLDYHDDLRLFVLEAPNAAIESMLAMDFVHSLELDARIVPAHDRSTRQIAVDYVRSIATNDGHDTVVGMMDSGMDLTHVDVNGHWYAGWGYDGQSPYIDGSGHGTHVMGTISGTGAADSRFRGCAPEVGATQDRHIYIAGIFGGPANNSTSSNAISAFARFAQPITLSGITTPIPSVTNHSWGVGTPVPNGGWVGTDSLSIALDFRVFNQRQTHVVAAHNQGGASYASQNLNGVLLPAVAKLALTVANCLSGEESGSLPGRPHFSSNKGPTGDGRLCPQVMAPGRSIGSVSAGTTNQYVSFSGTSMASPHVTGTIAGLHTHYPWMKTSPAATRAVMAATTNPYLDDRNFTSSSDSYYHRQGFGQIDAYKAHYQRDEAGGYLAGRVYGTLDANDGGAYFDIDVPADATRTLFVLAFDEAPASQGAVRSCVHDLDLHLDVEPFTAGFDTGEYHATRSFDTWDWYGNIASIAQVRGRRVRVKIHPSVAPTGSDVVHYGVAYMIPRGETSPAGTITATASATLLRPGQQFGLNVQIDVPEYVQSNAFVALAPSWPLNATQLSFVDRGNLPRLYTGSNVPLDWTLGAQGHWFALAHRSLDWQLVAPGNGIHTLCAQMFADNRAAMTQDCLAICVDDQPPFLMGNVTSPTHQEGVWVNSETFRLQWAPTNDVGCAGMGGFAYTVAFGAATTPGTTPMLPANATSLELQLGTSAQDRYVAVRAIDRNGNANLRVIHGPVRIDTALPQVTSVQLDGGATFVTTTSVTAQVAASDAHSGLDAMRWSWDGATWSTWQPFNGAPFAVALGSFGGNTSEGIKTLRVQVRDLAGNVSATATDSIEHLRCPQLTSLSTARLANVGAVTFDLVGRDLADITALRLGSILLPRAPVPFGRGSYEVVSDALLRVTLPQALPPASYTVQVDNRACSSGTLPLEVVLPSRPALAAPASVTAGQAFTVFASRGGMAAATQVGLALSPSNLPSSFPGVVDLAIGNQFQVLVLLPTFVPTDPTTGATSFTLPSVPSLAGQTWHLQAVLIDPTSTTPLPLSTSNAAAVAFL